MPVSYDGSSIIQMHSCMLTQDTLLKRILSDVLNPIPKRTGTGRDGSRDFW